MNQSGVAQSGVDWRGGSDPNDSSHPNEPGGGAAAAHTQKWQ